MSETFTIRVETHPTAVKVYRVGSSTPVVVHNAAPDLRAYIHPIVVPGGTASVTENAPAHHPWQHGLYVGISDINGAGFWHEKIHPNLSADDGSFHPRIISPAQADGSTATWAVESEYRDKTGCALLTETQHWSFTDHGDRYTFDLVLTFHALVDLTFGRYDYGGLFIRMPFRREVGGRAFTSEGLENGAAEAQRANWVATQMPIPGSDTEAVVAITDHPLNREHPVPWRVDGELGFVPSVSIAGAWQLPEGQDEVFRHRVIVFSESVEPELVDAEWIEFSGGAGA